ncbi:MAG: SufD family Fe-S cluster assembly protein [Puniceicoccales bacterium]|jgi:Fe-S cluster assembly protein SufD|nr:SufD family Fe-S cluster assembly protein [Puniceicoccales bacterium]
MEYGRLSAVLPSDGILNVPTEFFLIDDLPAEACYELRLDVNAHCKFALHLGRQGRKIRRQVTFALCGTNSRLDAHVLIQAATNQRIEWQGIQRHLVPDANSNLLIKSIAGAGARVSITSKIIIDPLAVGSCAHFRNKNLVISSRAHVIARPELEIFANDVRCSHGAAIGGTDPAEEFYLRSRGIPPPAAKTILKRAFAEEILRQIPDDDQIIGPPNKIANEY